MRQFGRQYTNKQIPCSQCGEAADGTSWIYSKQLCFCYLKSSVHYVFSVQSFQLEIYRVLKVLNLIFNAFGTTLLIFLSAICFFIAQSSFLLPISSILPITGYQTFFTLLSMHSVLFLIIKAFILPLIVLSLSYPLYFYQLQGIKHSLLCCQSTKRALQKPVHAFCCYWNTLVCHSLHI